ncbi:MAG: zf-HC2 domain-containing protein, partial [Candidatus Zixiibacteriota bacterium]
MKSCKYEKRLQLYLDGWMERSESARFEKHLKKCSICQSEVMELEDISAAALEIVDEAPERGYWNSFYPRTQNRIISRSITPYKSSGESRRGLRLKIGTYSLEIVSLAAVILLTVNFLPDILNRIAEKSPNQLSVIQQSKPVSVVKAIDNVQSADSLLFGETDRTMLDENPEPVNSGRQATEFVSIESI